MSVLLTTTSSGCWGTILSKSQGLCKRECVWVILSQEDIKHNGPVEFAVDRKWPPGMASLASEAIPLLRAHAIQQRESSLILNPATYGVVLCLQTTHSSLQRYPRITMFSRWDRADWNPPLPGTHFAIHKARCMEHQKGVSQTSVLSSVTLYVGRGVK